MSSFVNQREGSQTPASAADSACDSKEGSRADWIRWGFCLLLAVLVLVVYARVHSYAFVDLDDDNYVAANPRVQAPLSLNSLAWAFTSGYFNNWHPVTWLSHMLDYHLFGLDAGMYHVVNVLFHLVNTLVLFEVLRRSTARPESAARLRNTICSGVVAALFAVHPLHVESVAWIADRKDLLSGCFGLLTVLAYLHYVTRPSILRYLPVLFLFALAVMSKSMLVTLPAVLLLLDYWPLGRLNPVAAPPESGWSRFGKLVLEKVPLFALSAGAGVAAFILRTPEMAPAGSRVANAIVASVGYIEKALWPVRLCVYYPHPGDTLSVARIAGSAAVLVLLTALALSQARRRPYLFVGWFWYLITLAPASGIVQIGSHATADRYTYLPLTGLFIAAVWAVADLVARRKTASVLAVAAAAAVCGVLVVLAYIQVGYWRNNVTLFEHALQAVPDNSLAHNALGGLYLREGRTEDARRHLEEALRIAPQAYLAQNNFGVLLGMQGDLVGAEEHIEAALRIKPDYAMAYCNLGRCRLEQQRYDEALDLFAKALQYADPADPHRLAIEQAYAQVLEFAKKPQ